ncbi:DUF924 family protein [soil metagenome]
MASEGMTAEDVVHFWKEAGMTHWFGTDDAFDAEFRERFLGLHERAASGQLEEWMLSAAGALALMILLDQFPRNSFRDSPRMFATDDSARALAERAIAAGFDAAVDPELRMFFYLPFEHSETMRDQDRSLALHETIGFTKYAVEHRDIIERFGRFPHRNAILGRTSTDAEKKFLAEGGFGG